ncbi:methyl-accepting chemotaxis protein [Paraburkholderia sp. BL25I1N1]|uniref:methyl-accepting chemotaxis protein n=1 Tax=Paraburkholderia sp. BL25I1N1 TaxID=1938804 RepID=UPI000D061DEC|nr:methyl-accepting chemotaxis protein [Paraburkholderia sp. BL25I1N1]PRY08189.1 methyl-accepting chemotaxis sensory transducer with TarH sensor [Paraburkholderia sp. BL25I1N1]
MRNVSVRKSLLAIFVIFATMILFGGVLGVTTLSRANANLARIHQIATQEILVNDGYKDSTRTRAALTRAYSALKERNDEATRDSALKSAGTTLNRAATETQSFRDAASFSGQDDGLKQQLVESSNNLAAILTKAVDAVRAGDTNAYVAINDRDITAAGAAYSVNVEKFQSMANTLSNDAIAQAEREYQWVVSLVVIGVAGALALIVATHFALRRIVTTPLKEAADLLDRIAANDLTALIPEASGNEIGQLFAAMQRMQRGLSQTVANVRNSCEAIYGGAREIAAGNLDLSSRTEQQSAALEQTAASMEQLTSTVKQNADNAQQASTQASSAADVAQGGGEVVERAIQTMNAISESSRRIAEITGMIDSIAFQTNILALNAAVESARAGEQGRGFAVVASEVRSLALRSADAAREIKALIGASVEDVANGNDLVAQAGQSMKEIVGAVRSVATIMNEIKAATIEQSTGIEQVGQAVTQMDQVTQQNAALVEEAAAAASALEQQAQLLTDAVSAFRLAR